MVYTYDLLTTARVDDPPGLSASADEMDHLVLSLVNFFALPSPIGILLVIWLRGSDLLDGGADLALSQVW